MSSEEVNCGGIVGNEGDQDGDNLELSKHEIEEKLIQYVFLHPTLYTKQSKNYKDQMIAENCYQEFGKTVKMDSGEVRSMWKGLRSQHTAYLRKLTKQTGQKRGHEPTFRHSKIMQFLCDHKTKSKSKSSYNSKKGERRSKRNESPRPLSPDPLFENSLMDDPLDFSERLNTVTDDLESNDQSTNEEDSTSTQNSKTQKSQPFTSNGLKPGAALLAQEAESRKRKRMTADEVDLKLVDTLENALNSSKQNQDESFYFVMSLLPAMRRISSKSMYKFAKLKLDIQTVLVQAEMAEESGIQSATNN